MSGRLKAIDLRATFGDRNRVTWEADGATRFSWPEAERVWLLELRCRYGVVYPYGGAILAAWTDRHRIGARLRRLPCVLSARGDLEVAVTFHVDDAEVVLAILKPYRRRRLSEMQRARQAEILARARSQQHRKSLSQDEFPAAGSTQSRPDGAAVGPRVADGSETAELARDEAASAQCTAARCTMTHGRFAPGDRTGAAESKA